MPLITTTGGGSVRGLGRGRGKTGPLFEFSSFTFISGGAGQDKNELRLPPILSDLESTYSSQDFYPFFSLESGGKQVFTIPEDGEYRISARGGIGGKTNPDPNKWGRPALMQATFSFTKEQQLRFVIGKAGSPARINPTLPEINPVTFNSGGGGGTFVFFNDSDSVPLLAAAGGGGSSIDANFAPHAGITADGTPGQGVGGQGVTLFSGLLSGSGAVVGFGGILDSINAHFPGMGAGWNSNGIGGHSLCEFPVSPGLSKAGDWVGGEGNNNNGFDNGFLNLQGGGFGGGGGGTGRCGSHCSGGGGGYTGGSYTTNEANPTKDCGQGGGSFVNTNLASNVSGLLASSSATHGYVTIEKL